MSTFYWLPDEATAPGRLALTSLPGGGRGRRLEVVRGARTPLAVESEAQEQFVRDFPADPLA